MTRWIARATVAIAAAVALSLPTPAGAHGGDTPDDAPSTGGPHAGHDMGGGDDVGHDTGGMDMDQDMSADAGGAHVHAPATSGDEGHDHASESDSVADGHEHGDGGESAAGGHEHGDESTDGDHDGGSHEAEPDTVSPEMRRLVLTSFAGVNGAVILAAFLIRRTDPARARKATR